MRLVTEEMDQAVVQAHHLQVGKSEFVRLADERYDAFEKRRTRAAGAARG